MKLETIEDLNQLYQEADAADYEVHAHMRTNIQLVLGNHYQKRDSKFNRALRSNTNLSNRERIRLVQNHIQNITKSYQNNILSLAASVGIGPRNEHEVADTKKAELHNSVWQFQKDALELKKFRRLCVKDFIELGELWVLGFYDPFSGPVIGEEPVLEEDGTPKMDQEGNPVMAPIFKGGIKLERFPGYNVRVDPSADNFEDARYVIFDKILPKKSLKLKYLGDEEKLKAIEAGSAENWKIFDSATTSYREKSANSVIVRHYFFRPSEDHAYGWFVYATSDGILEQGPLPHGFWPILHVGFDEITGTTRSQSIIRPLRPYQQEINRCASNIAECQEVFGKPKIVTHLGSNLDKGISGAGYQHLKTSGPAPVILPGLSGDQYLGYMNQKISEMYQIAKLSEDSQEKVDNNVDAYAMLFRSIRQKKVFSIYADKIQEFEKNLCKMVLFLSKKHLPDDEIIPIIGRNEIVNIAEFRSSDDLQTEIKLEDQTEDIESKMGRQLSLNHIMQYAGAKLPPTVMGQLITHMPYVNQKQMFTDLTTDYDNMRNVILRLDRGEAVQAKPNEDHDYALQKLNWRMKQPDFDFLPPQVQQNYYLLEKQHNEIIMQKKQEAAALSQGFVPSSGYLVTCDFYVPKPDDPTKTMRVRIPSDSLQWLLKTMQAQGNTIQSLQTVNPYVTNEEAAPLSPMQQPIPEPSINLPGMANF